MSYRDLLQGHDLLAATSSAATMDLQRQDLPLAANIPEDLKSRISHITDSLTH